MKPRPLPILAALCLVATVALACRYTVRDIGFINLAGRIYTLWIVTDDPAQAQAALDSARAEYKLANIESKLLDTRTQPEHALANQRGVILEGPGGRTLHLGDLDTAESAIETAVTSPVREDILEGAVTAFATIVLIESGDSESDANASAQIDNAIAAFNAMAPTLPREVTLPLRRVTLSPDVRDREQVFLWSLGFDSANDHIGAEPVVAVLYGRLKLAGPVLVGGGLTVRTLASQLSLVGESCECEANRDWVNEAALPHRWTEPARQAAATALGFDPGSPMVQAEALRIIERGVLTTGGPVGPREGQDDAMASFFGYSEITIGEPTTNAPEVATQPTAPIEHRTLNPEPDQEAISTEEVVTPRSVPGLGDGSQPNRPPPQQVIPVVPIIIAAGGLAVLGVIGAVVILLRKPAA